MQQLWEQLGFTIFLFAVIYNKPELEVLGELFTSADEVSNWRQIKSHVVNSLDKYIEVEENKLLRLKIIQNSLQETLKSSTDVGSNEELSDNNLTLSRNIAHPVEAFVALNRIVKTIEDIELLFELNDTEQEDITWLSSKVKLEQINLSQNTPTREDVIGCGEALIRLQEFYDLEVDDIVMGRLHPTNIAYTLPAALHMQASDCFTLGQIAYQDENFHLAIKWFQKTLELFEEEEELAHQREIFRYPDLGEVLDHMAFSAYRIGQLTFAAEITKLWLDIEPNNERAERNLDYYLEEIDNERVFGEDGSEKGGNVSFFQRFNLKQFGSDSNYVPEIQPPDKFKVSRDMAMRDLCRNNSEPTDYDCSIYFSSPLLGFKIETLHLKPTIFRVYDIITDSEAQQLREAALPKLERSTVRHDEQKSRISKYRIGKTAWLSRDDNMVVSRVKRRLNNLLNLSSHSVDRLQVVNYGSGGYYGPHLDVLNFESRRIGQQFKESSANDRLATVLIYLNSVELGGATAFTTLGISAEPIKNSAVVWFNYFRNGSIDERMMHTGCPILLGSKWIATEWIYEADNIFLRPCPLRVEDEE